jgi:hypothetical protein
VADAGVGTSFHSYSRCCRLHPQCIEERAANSRA